MATLRRIADQLAALEPAKAIEALVLFQPELTALQRRAEVVLARE